MQNNPQSVPAPSRSKASTGQPWASPRRLASCNACVSLNAAADSTNRHARLATINRSEGPPGTRRLAPALELWSSRQLWAGRVCVQSKRLSSAEHAASRTDGNAEPDSSAALGASFHTPALHAPVSLPPAAPGAGIQRAVRVRTSEDCCAQTHPAQRPEAAAAKCAR